MLAQHTMWHPTSPERARLLTDARQQLHHAVQFGAAFGISYLPRRDDDGHTNLAWDTARTAFVTDSLDTRRGSVRVGVRPADLTLLVLCDETETGSIRLPGLTIMRAADALQVALGNAGLDATRYHLARHYEIPGHAVASGAPFDGTDTAALQELAHAFGNASIALERARARINAHAGNTDSDHDASDTVASAAVASNARLWPHHFDLATLVQVGAVASTGAGMAGGDQYYDEPYYYVNAYPRPRTDRLTASLAGDGSWHTFEWIGAVLPASRLRGDAVAQERQVDAFLESALAACRALVTG